MKHKILLRKCEQVGMYDWDNHYRSVELENSELDNLVKTGWCIFGAEDAPQNAMVQNGHIAQQAK